MKAHTTKIVGEGLTYDDVLLIPNYSEVLPREVSIQSKFSKNITLNVPIVSAAMDTVTESAMKNTLCKKGKFFRKYAKHRKYPTRLRRIQLQ